MRCRCLRVNWLWTHATFACVGRNPPVRSHHAILVLTSTTDHAGIDGCTGVKENQKPKSMTGTWDIAEGVAATTSAKPEPP